jgi:hypothetical protein
MTSILYRASSGVAGDVTRQDDTVVESGLFNTAKVPAEFGAPVKITAGKIEKIESGDVAASLFGFLSRLAPSIAGDTAQIFGSGTPNPVEVQGIIVRGRMNVKCKVGTPARNGIVYMRVVEALPKLIGDLEATSDTINSVALTGVTWSVGGVDANFVTEIRIK